MNKSLLMAITACAAMAMTSCSSEDLTGGTTKANETPISFSTYLGRAAESRATIATSGGVPSFGVFAFYTGQDLWTKYTDKTNPNFMHNQEVQGTAAGDGTWSYTYSPLKYWPNNDGDKVSFFAYAPYNSSQGWGSGSPTITIPNDVKQQEDILVAPALKDQEKPTVDSKLTFNFKHALSRIGFEVAYAADGTKQSDDKTIDKATTITLSKIELHKADGKTTEGVFYTKGIMNMTGNGNVSGTDANDVQAFTLTNKNFKQTDDVAADFNVTNKYQQLNADDSYIMIIPQELGGETGTGFDITVTYTVSTVDNTNKNNNSTITNVITKNVKLSFEAGKAYNLKLLLGMTSVKIDASATDWTSSDIPVDVPANK